MMLNIGKYTFESRLLLGTGKFSDFEVQSQAVDASGTEVLTFAVRRLNLEERNQKHFLDTLDLDKYTLLPNTAGASTAEEAVRIAELARASGLCDMIKSKSSEMERHCSQIRLKRTRLAKFCLKRASPYCLIFQMMSFWPKGCNCLAYMP